MKVSDIYAMAYPMVAKPRNLDGLPVGEGDAPDYSAAVPQLVNALTIEQAALAAIYAQVSGAESGFSPTRVNGIDDLMPLPERFTPAAVYFIAEKLSYKNSYEAAALLHRLYLEEIARIRRELPAVSESIVNRY